MPPSTKPFKAPSMSRGGEGSNTSRAPSKAPAKATARTKAPAAKKKTANVPIVVSDDDEDESDDLMDSDVQVSAGPSKRRSTTSRHDGPSTPRRHSTTALAAAEDNPIALLEDDLDEVSIPRPLLARLLYHGFEDKNMRIGKEPMGIMEVYTKLFVKEALARSKQETVEKAGAATGDTTWLQVEDLEKIAPQLMLDF